MAAQLIHAADESVVGPCPEGTLAVALSVPDECALLDLEKRLIGADIPHKAIREPDRGYELMAIGIRPCDRRLVRKEVSNLPLVR